MLTVPGSAIVVWHCRGMVYAGSRDGLANAGLVLLIGYTLSLTFAYFVCLTRVVSTEALREAEPLSTAEI